MKVTVTYRNWLGASKHGLLVESIRMGHGKAMNPKQAPAHVRAYLTLKPVNTPKGYECMEHIKTEKQLFDCESVKPLRRAPYSTTHRFTVDIPNPRPTDKPLKGISPRSVGGALRDYEGPGQLYRAAYKYTACGPSVGLILRDLRGEGHEPIYCNDLYELGTWAEMAQRGQKIAALVVSSIVEGVDYGVPPIEVPASPIKTLGERFWNAVSDVNSQAEYIWQSTHGCDTCRSHWESLGIDPDDSSEFGGVAVWTECPDCEGAGIVI